MYVLKDPARRLSLLLWLVAAHSAAVGIGLMAHPAGIFARMGYAPLAEPFFAAQGGVFHIVMAIGYSLGAWDIRRNRTLVWFSIVVKAVATVFLLLYWLLIDDVIVVLASGLLDGAMAVIIALAYYTWRRSAPAEGT